MKRNEKSRVKNFIPVRAGFGAFATWINPKLGLTRWKLERLRSKVLQHASPRSPVHPVFPGISCVGGGGGGEARASTRKGNRCSGSSVFRDNCDWSRGQNSGRCHAMCLPNYLKLCTTWPTRASAANSGLWNAPTNTFACFTRHGSRFDAIPLIRKCYLAYDSKWR